MLPVKDGRTYIVLTKDDGLVYKRVYNKIKEHNALLLSSDSKFTIHMKWI